MVDKTVNVDKIINTISIKESNILSNNTFNIKKRLKNP